MRVWALAVALLAVGTAGGCIGVDSPDGVLVCSTVPGRQCPHGFYCAPDNTCWRDGDPFTGDLSAPFMPGPPPPQDQLDMSVTMPDDLAQITPDDLTPNDDLSSSD